MRLRRYVFGLMMIGCFSLQLGTGKGILNDGKMESPWSPEVFKTLSLHCHSSRWSSLSVFVRFTILFSPPERLSLNDSIPSVHFCSGSAVKDVSYKELHSTCHRSSILRPDGWGSIHRHTNHGFVKISLVVRLTSASFQPHCT